MSEVEEYINGLKTRLQEVENAKNSAEGNLTANQIYNAANSESHNLIEFQLELNDILDRMQHLLRGHIIKIDEKGNEYWDAPTDENLKLFNDYGVTVIMNILTNYLNRNTILSNYDEETIHDIIYDLSTELTDQIYTQYELMGLDSPQKRKRYPIIVKQISHTIFSTYLRALNGGERGSLRSARMVMQNDAMGNLPMPKKSKFNILKPTTWAG